MNIQVIIPLVILLIFIFTIGMFFSKYVAQTNSFIQEYFLGSRELGGFVLAMTMIATYGSASSFLGGPGAAYKYGLGWVLLAMSQVVSGYFVLMILGKKFAIVVRKYNAVTITDYLKSRYESNLVAILSAVSIIIFLFSAMIAQWVGGALLLESLMGISYNTALFVFAISVLIYVIVGGFRAVVVTDSIQGIIMLFGTIVILTATIISGGGIENIMKDLYNENPNLLTPYGSDLSLTPIYLSSFWILVGVGVVGLPQMAVRAMSYKSAKAMHRAIIVGTIVVGIIMFGMHLTGVFARVILPNVEVLDSVMPELTLAILPPWLAGIVLAAPLAAIMSTVDSLLLLVSSAVVKDIYLTYINPNAEMKKIKKISFFVTATIGIVVCLLAIQPPELIIWLNLFSFGGLEAVFIWPVVLGLYWKTANKYGAIASMLAGMSTYVLSHMWYPNPLGMHTVVLPIMISFVVFIVVSYMTKAQIGLCEDI